VTAVSTLVPGEPPYHEEELTPIRKAIADRVSRSRTEIPEFHVHAEVDAEHVLAFRGGLKERVSPVPTINDIIIKLCGMTLRGHPVLNAAFVDGKVRVYEDINVGFAAATPKGVLIPVVRRADRRPIADIARETKEMVELARAGRLRASLQQGGTFTVSNMGPGHVDSFNAIISPPQTAILAIGSLAPRPLVADGELTVRRTMKLTLTVDHRAVDGADAASFMNSLVEAAAEPAASCAAD